jgi:tRNA isopentenyl-2-thiomethyl-A-37 hydroxylase MiaE
MTEVEKKDELTFSFNDNGKEHKVEELSDENRLLYNKTVLCNQEIARLQQDIARLQFEIEIKQLAASKYSNELKEAVEGDEPKVEVVK